MDLLRRPLLRQAGGIAYALTSVLLSVYALRLLSPYLSNDALWASFAETAVPLVQSFNDALALSASNVSFNLLDRSVARWHRTRPSQVLVSAIYARKVLFEDMSVPLAAISALRTYDVSRLSYLMTGYCYVDLARRWSLAHTDRRMQRCAERYTDNGAVYLEAILRNVEFDEWYASNAASFDASIGNGVATSPGGDAWLASLHNDTWRPLPDELRVWTDAGIKAFTLQYANRIRTGINEGIGVANALGLAHTLSLKTIPSADMGTFWTTSYLFAGLQTDWNALPFNTSLVRSTPNFFGFSYPNVLEDYNVGSPMSALHRVLHDDLGPFASVDLYWVPVPAALLASVHAVHVAVGSSPVDAALNAIPDTTLHPTPTKWLALDHETRFLGGSPFCTFGMPLPFVQESFGFDDACASQIPLAVL
ncbi:hypothetical protein SDRG_03741 [Saprolegnia diclina VS20]|uniref:Uncharacterized protein n=1 Tax=Saprolegnia diclina (strain VS20) TaxID=1156394 RepID=T0S7Q3_SAPDV|nr:hypothetical protein SDRG_03741 [Saprolegnia diclina VS20]EQC38782.1 hypothetical protein SDRG_03741 [Saprolegnia diclina VS20]|eukprot:XP_008607606.1 hypothetical protein SDRG_03741 [Saprolegnia diclina VS20]